MMPVNGNGPLAPVNDRPPSDERSLGLTETEAATRLAREGFNEFPRPESRDILSIVAEVLREPMLALLILGGVIYLLLGDIREALILLVFGTLSVVITVVQESRTERVLEALRDLTSPRALVIRNGERKRIAGREVVPGDLIVLSEGDRIPADAVLLECNELQADESLLTGESAPVRKVVRASRAVKADARPGGDDLPWVFSGALIVSGGGIAEVTATGLNSEIGKIGQSLSTLSTEPPRLRLETRRIVRLFAVSGGAVSLVVVLLFGIFRGGWLAAVLAGIAVGMSLLPEEFPVVLTVFMAMGAWRISRARVLTRRSAAIETLGAATVLCTDKTGTLTVNRMSVAELRLNDGAALAMAQRSEWPLPGRFAELIRHAILASAPNPFDPMEKAFRDLAARQDGSGLAPPRDWALIRTYGLRSNLLAITQIWRHGNEPALLVAAKGAPEAIARLCRLTPEQLSALKAQTDEMAQNGLRVLGIACAQIPDRALPDNPEAFPFRFLGLAGLADPLRETVPDAIRECRSAGIRVVMITGDYPATAGAIGRTAGLDTGQIITGEDLAHMPDSELAEQVRNAAVFARILPEQKLRIVNALKANGEIVAMTGDGVNDAPSLKSAHIGIAMGGRGTDVAREASSIVLLDDDFGSIVKAIGLGRRIYDNLRKATGFILAVHVPIAGLALVPLISGLPIIFGPIHIAFLEMIIDPVCSLVFEAETAEPDVMARPPRSPGQPLFSARFAAWSVVQGVAALALPLAVYLLAVCSGMPENEIRAITFFALVTAIVALIFVNRSFSASLIAAFRRPNPALMVVLFFVAGILTLSLAWPVVRNLFHFGPLHADDLGFALGAGFAVLVLLEIVKQLWRAIPGRDGAAAVPQQ